MNFSVISIVFFLVGFLGEIQIPLLEQLVLSSFVISVMLALYNWDLFRNSRRSKLLARYTIIFSSAYFGWRYLYWRATETMPTGYGWESELAGWLLLMAEGYGFVMLMFNHLVNIHPIDHRIPELPTAEDDFPFIDVFIPTYNEELDVIIPTLAAAVHLDYPRARFQVWLLDDGGTDKKCQQKDEEKSRMARERRVSLKSLATSYGARYLTRKANEHAKAGNINNALTHSTGDLVAILDCDHIPTRDFLRSTAPFFLQDEKLFLVQTPHNFVTQDPVEKNLALPRGPGENELFYEVMQPGLDFWGTSYFCGSAAVLREPVLKSLGGIAGQTITEDAETTIDAMRLGFRTLYLNKPMVSGLQPETVTGMVIQRVRWGTGMLQIFLLKNPWLQKGLSFVQKLLYTNLIVYWLFAYSRLVLLMAPPAYLIFGITICHTTPTQLLVFLVPYLLSSLLVAQHYYRRVRWPFVSQVYETLQSVFIAMAMTKVFWRPKSPSFKVTPKGEFLDRHFVSVLSWPFYLLLAVNLLAIIRGINLMQQTGAQTDAVAFVLFWAVLDTLFLLAVLGVTHEKPQRRASARVPLHKEVNVQLEDGVRVSGYTEDISWRGSAIAISPGHAAIHMGTAVHLDFGQGKTLSGKINGLRDAAAGKRVVLSIRFDNAEVGDVIAAVAVAYGASADLAGLAQARRRSRSILGALGLFMRLALVFGTRHVWHLAQEILFHRAPRFRNALLFAMRNHRRSIHHRKTLVRARPEVFPVDGRLGDAGELKPGWDPSPILQPEGVTA
ncbi:UDP-forming cellulose synthase catalytic subunit [Acidithiobacillus sp. IBUN Pt1247-S3]|uniref:UDP-forming cellulose synthase catalytic subunit n=1 Tax=Acidithiobacillus sp. IBUN Pt1247-S3 TaxID=3166642 RepID=UPI0034E37A54